LLRGRGVEHLAPTIAPFGDFGTTPAPAHPARCARALAIRRVHTVEEDGVKMRVEPEVAVGALDDRHGAKLAGGQAAVDGLSLGYLAVTDTTSNCKNWPA